MQFTGEHSADQFARAKANAGMGERFTHHEKTENDAGIQDGNQLAPGGTDLTM